MYTIYKLEETYNDFPIPTLVYRLTCKNISFHYLVSSINIDEILAKPESLRWNCKESHYIKRSWTHNASDIRLISDNKLQKILCKSHKFRKK